MQIEAGKQDHDTHCFIKSEYWAPRASGGGLRARVNLTQAAFHQEHFTERPAAPVIITRSRALYPIGTLRLNIHLLAVRAAFHFSIEDEVFVSHQARLSSLGFSGTIAHAILMISRSNSAHLSSMCGSSPSHYRIQHQPPLRQSSPLRHETVKFTLAHQMLDCDNMLSIHRSDV